MPKPMFQKVDESKVENEIKAIVGNTNFGRLKAEQPEFLEGFRRLGVLMTDADTCYKALSVLNDLLLEKLSHTTIEVTKSRLPTVNDGEVKHYGLLSGFFKA